MVVKLILFTSSAKPKQTAKVNLEFIKLYNDYSAIPFSIVGRKNKRRAFLHTLAVTHYMLIFAVKYDIITPSINKGCGA